MTENEVRVTGYLGKPPEFKVLPGGSKVCNFSVATSRKWKDKAGVEKEETQWHEVVTWGRVAEAAAKMLEKGSNVSIKGELVYRKWEKDGQNHVRAEIKAFQVGLLDKERTKAAWGGAGKEEAPDHTDGDAPPF